MWCFLKSITFLLSVPYIQKSGNNVKSVIYFHKSGNMLKYINDKGGRSYGFNNTGKTKRFEDRKRFHT